MSATPSHDPTQIDCMPPHLDIMTRMTLRQASASREVLTQIKADAKSNGSGSTR